MDALSTDIIANRLPLKTSTETMSGSFTCFGSQDKLWLLRRDDLREEQYGRAARVASDLHRQLEAHGEDSDGARADDGHDDEDGGRVVRFVCGRKQTPREVRKMKARVSGVGTYRPR